jgi:hypothetical protein
MAMMAPAIASSAAVPAVVTILRGRLFLVRRLRLRITSCLWLGLRCGRSLRRCRSLRRICHGQRTCKEQKT